ncbi:MAG: flagellar basal body rod protein FlgC [Candidatus Krumholzibacteriia bacterium]
MSDGFFRGIRISASGLHAQRVKMDTVAENLANAETTRTEEGLPYRRQRAAFAEALQQREGRLRAVGGTAEPGRDSGLAITDPAHFPGGRPRTPTGGQEPQGVDVAVGVAPEASDFKVIYDPGHPDADADGYVLLPNVNPISEMVDLITATRAYEANASAVQSAKDMFTKALEI